MHNPLAQARNATNLTQKELSILAKVSPVVITNVENGLYLEPPPSVLLALAERITPNNTILETGQTYPNPYLTSATMTTLPPAETPIAAPEVVRTARKLKALYEVWVHQQRQAHKKHFDAHNAPRTSTFTQWRKSIHPSQYGFCKLLVFDPRILQYYESDGSRPNTLFAALSEVLPEAQVKYLRDLPPA